MADVDPFDEALMGIRRIMIDLDGDGIPDAVTTMDVRNEMGRIGAANRPTGLPEYLQQGQRDAQLEQGAYAEPYRANKLHPLLGVLGEAAQFSAEMTGIPGMVRGAENIRQGVGEGSMTRTAMGAGQAALGALPIASASRPVANALFADAPRAMATVGAPMAAMLPFQMGEAQASGASKANAAVGSDPEVVRLRNELKALNQRRLDVQATSIKGQKAASADASRSRMDAAIADQIKATESLLTQAEGRARTSYTQNAPFREKYPEAVPAIMAAGGAMAFGMPFAGAFKNRVSDAFRAGRLGREADDIVQQANVTGPGAVPVAELATRQARLEQSASAFSDAKNGFIPGASSALNTAGSIGMSGLTMAEASALPEQLDYMLYPPGHPARETATQLFRNPDYYKDRLAPFVGGAGLGLTGKKMANMLTPGAALDQPRIDAAVNLGTPQMLDRMNRISQHRQWVQNPPRVANPGAGAALPPAGPPGGNAGPQRGLPPPPAPGPGSPLAGAAYEQAGAHGQIARQYLDELLTLNQGSKSRLTNNPNLTEIVARNLEARYASAGVPMPDPAALRVRAEQTVDALRRADSIARTGRRGTMTAPALRDDVLGMIQGNPGMLSLPIASGMGGNVLNALAPRPDNAD